MHSKHSAGASVGGPAPPVWRPPEAHVLLVWSLGGLQSAAQLKRHVGRSCFLLPESLTVQVVERVLGQLAADVNRDAACPALGVVRLNGVVHAEERVAFREIARQLCLCAPAPSRCMCIEFAHCSACAGRLLMEQTSFRFCTGDAAPVASVLPSSDILHLLRLSFSMPATHAQASVACRRQCAST